MVRTVYAQGILFVLAAYWATFSQADDDVNRQRLANFFRASSCEVVCVDARSNAEVEAIGQKLAAWMANNQQRVLELAKANPGRPFPYQEDFGITRQEYAMVLSAAKTEFRLETFGDPMHFAIQRDGNIVSFLPKKTNPVLQLGAVQAAPQVVNWVLSNTKFNLQDLTVDLRGVRTEKGKWVERDGGLLGQQRGFEWLLEDDRILNHSEIPPGETACYLSWSVVYAPKHKQVYCEVKLAFATQQGLDPKPSLRFWMKLKDRMDREQED